MFHHRPRVLADRVVDLRRRNAVAVLQNRVEGDADRLLPAPCPRRSPPPRGRRISVQPSRSQYKAIQIALVAPFGKQLTEGVKARSVRFTEVEPDAFASTAAFVVVIAWRALQVERSVVNRGLPDGFTPSVLRLLTGLDGHRAAFQGFGDDV